MINRHSKEEGDECRDGDRSRNEDERVEVQSNLSEKEKLSRLLEYWAQHNQEHAKTYLEWSKKADGQGLKDVVRLLEEASDLTMSINQLFKRALERL